MHHHHHHHAAGNAAPVHTHADPVDLAPLGTAAAAPDRVGPAPNDDAPGVMAEGVRMEEIVDSQDFAATHIAEQDKAFATARAKLALAGWVLHIVDGGNGGAAYWVSRWGQSRTLPDAHALAQFIKQVGVKS